MDSEIDESHSIKRRKTEGNDEEIVEEMPVSVEPAVNDIDTYLQDFFSKRPKSNLPMFQRVINQEELEAKQRDADEDLKLYRDACADFSDCVAEIAEIKLTKDEGWKDTINELRKEAAFIALIMKKLNRVEKTRTRISREQICKERQKADISQVKLDNMLSEIQHMRKEIEKCLQFRNKPLGIDLVPIEEFYEKASIEISKPEITKNDKHQLQLARLEWELRQRKELAGYLNALQAKKRMITEDIDKKESDLNSLGPLVKDVLQVTRPLQEKLGPGTSKTTKISEQASLLPDPLYFLYVNAVAYNDACDKVMTLEINGDLEKARRCKAENKPVKDHSKEVDNVKETSSKKNVETEKNKLLSLHPLSVILKIPMKDEPILKLEFFYLTNLNIMSVIPAIIFPSESKSAYTDALANHKYWLDNLFPEDNGKESPNLVNYYQLLKANVEALDVETLGHPYIWVQKIGGLNFCGLNKRVYPKLEVSRSNFPIVIKELKKRCRHRLSLLKVIESISHGNLIPPQHMESIKTKCSVKSLQLISWADYSESPLTEHLKDSSCLSENDIHLKVIIMREEESMTCLISVKAEYPSVPCVFAVNWEGSLDENERKGYSLDIEREVNVHWKELSQGRFEALLSCQLFQAMICFDIVLESLIPDKFSSSKQLKTTSRGRELPFKYDPEENTFVHRIVDDQ